MKTQKHSGGFTIIEVMLFLAITGALTVGILVGSGAAIGQQRYRDSVNSFKGLIQEQYSQIANVVNSEAEKPVCARTGDNLSFSDDIQKARGTSECLIMGRFMLVNANEVTVYNVVGQPGAGASSGDDTDILGEYALALQSPELHEVSWRARIVEPKSNNDSLSSVLIIRSPVSGATLTYIQDGDHTGAIGEMIGDTNMVEKNFCVDSNGGSAMANRLAVRINARATNQSAVEIPLEMDGVCD